MRRMKSTFAGMVIAAGLLAVFLAPQTAAASCFCLSERFNGSGSAIGETCSIAQNNLISSLSNAADSSCQFRGYNGACNIVIRTGACSNDPFNPGFMRVDGTLKYSCFVCF